MNSRVLIGGVCSVVCVVALWRISAQRQELSSLRADEQQLREQPAAAVERLMSVAADVSRRSVVELILPGGTAANGAVPAADSSTRDLMRLRAEVTRLAEQQREFSSVRAENERLHAQVAARATNAAARALPPDYILASKAQFAGFNTPDATLETFMWAARNHDLTNFLQTLIPEAAQEFRRHLQQEGGSPEQALAGGEDFPGMRIVDRQSQPDGSIELKIQVVPGESETQPIRVRLVDGQWKLELH